MYKAAIFDMDGTILNTITDLTESINHSLSLIGEKHDFTEEEVKLCFGCGIRADMEKSLAMARGCPLNDLEWIGNQIPLSDYHITEEELIGLENLFNPYYASHSRNHTAPYEGIPEVLHTLIGKGIQTAVASNKNDSDVQILSKAIFPGLFTLSIGNSENIRRKPAPDMIHEILDKLHLSKEEAIYIGDSEVDIETARNAGIPCISVAWGFRTEDFLSRHHAERIITSPEEMVKIISDEP